MYLEPRANQLMAQECPLCGQFGDSESRLEWNAIIVCGYEMCPQCRMRVSPFLAIEASYRAKWVAFMGDLARNRTRVQIPKKIEDPPQH
jgi:hypothetical protein